MGDTSTPGDGAPDLGHKAGLDFSRHFIVAVAEPAEDDVFLDGHSAEVADGAFELMLANEVGGGREALRLSLLAHDDGVGEEVADALRADVGENGDDADEVGAGKHIGGSEEVPAEGGDEASRRSIRENDSQMEGAFADGLSVPEALLQDKVQEEGHNPEQKQEIGAHFCKEGLEDCKQAEEELCRNDEQDPHREIEEMGVNSGREACQPDGH